jgi:alpha-N-acetylglucosamine transferase
MDELFLLPQVPVAMPRAYWLDDTMSSQLMVIEPSQIEFERIENAFTHRNEECLVLSPQKYNLITGEFRNNQHHRYIGSSTEKWDASRALKEAKYLHFSDWPYPKPWSEYSHVTHERLQPDCEITLEGEEDCSSRDVWDGIYDEFLSRRQVSCPSHMDKL